MPSRPVTVYASEAEEFLFEKDDFVKAVRVRLSVSKGTYIRSLARDIGSHCKSAAGLAGLRRLSVGSFRLEDAAGVSSLKPFTIRSVYETISEMRESNAALCKEGSPEHIPHAKGEVPPSLSPRPRAYEKGEQSEVREKMQTMTERLAVECGFRALRIFSEYEDDFKHGRPLLSSMFEKTAGGIGEARGTSSDLGACAKSDARPVNGDCTAAGGALIAVFGSRNRFLGMITESGSGAYSYAFVRSD